MRTKAERRFLNITKAISKRKRCRSINMYYDQDEDMYDNLHQYSKNGIYGNPHYADAHCHTKTNNRGRRKYYGQASKRWKASDLRKVVGLEEQLWNIHLN